MSSVLHWRRYNDCVGEIESIRSLLFGMRDATWYNTDVLYPTFRTTQRLLD
jgi:hypothetical protein